MTASNFWIDNVHFIFRLKTFIAFLNLKCVLHFGTENLFFQTENMYLIVIFHFGLKCQSEDVYPSTID